LGKCNYCGTPVELPSQCNFCYHDFCDKHRLPENHDCKYAPARTPLGRWNAPGKNPSALTEGKARKTTTRAKEITISESPFHFIKKRVPVIDISQNKPKKKKPRFVSKGIFHFFKKNRKHERKRQDNKQT
jgi:hypothetical protein